MIGRKGILAAALLLVASCSADAAGALTTYSTRAAFGTNVSVDWGGLGATSGAGLLIGAVFNNLQSSVSTVAVSGTSASALTRLDQGVNYFGNFASGDRLLMTTAVAARGQIARAPGPIRFTFSTGPVFGAGMQVSTDVLGAFTATLKAFDASGALLDTVTASGNSTNPAVGDNSAPFLGVRSTLQEIAAVEVDVPGLTGVTVNRMDIALTNTILVTAAAAVGKVTTYTTALSYIGSGDATVDWGGLGVAATAPLLVGNFNNFGSNVPGVTVSGSSLSDLFRVDQGATYFGNFASGDKLLFTSGVAPRGGTAPKAPGPIRFTFNSGPVYGAGLQISTAVLGPFTATLKAFNSQGVLLGQVSAAGTSTAQTIGDNSAPFLGIRSSAREIAAIEVDTPGATGVAVNKLRIGLSGSLLSIDSFFASVLFRDLLNLPPDPATVANLSAGLSSGATTRGAVANTFFLDPRFQNNGLFVAKAYLAAVQADPDFATWHSLVNLMNGGTSPNAALGILLSTPAAHAIWGDPACVGGATGCTTNAAYVTQLYQDLLGRAPDAAGLAYWTFLLNLNFFSRTDVMMGFIQSPEYASLIHTRATVNLLYVGFLRRTGEPAGLAYWITTLNFGVPLLTVVQDFVSSPEYLARF